MSNQEKWSSGLLFFVKSSGTKPTPPVTMAKVTSTIDDGRTTTDDARTTHGRRRTTDDGQTTVNGRTTTNGWRRKTPCGHPTLPKGVRCPCYSQPLLEGAVVHLAWYLCYPYKEEKARSIKVFMRTW